MSGKTSWGLVIATGEGQFLPNGTELAYLSLGPQPVLAHVLLAFESSTEIDKVLVMSHPQRTAVVESLAKRFNCRKLVRVLPGLGTRRANIHAGLSVVEEEADVVTVHETNRPFIRADAITACVVAARKFGNAVIAQPLEDPIRLAGAAPEIKSTIHDADLWCVQSPRCYNLAALRKAIKSPAAKSDKDELLSLERAKNRIRLVDPGRPNPQIRVADDLAFNMALIG